MRNRVDPVSDSPPDAIRIQRQNGQATVEFALSLSAILVAVLMVAQIMAIGRDQLLVELAARNAAREAAVASDITGAAQRSAARSLADLTHRVSTSSSELVVTVEIEMPLSTRLPIVGVWLGRLELRARSTMPLEPPEPTEGQSRVTTMSTWSYEPEPMW